MSTPATAARAAKARAVLVAFVALTSVIVVVQTWWAIVQDRQQSMASERDNGLVAVRLLEEHAQQQLDVAANRLENIIVGIGTLAAGRRADETLVREAITDGLKYSRAAGAFQFVNPQGRRWASTIDFPSYVFEAEQRDYIGQLLAQPQRKTVLVGRPLQRFIDGELVLPLARNVYDRDGTHLGLISTEVSLAYFEHLYVRMAERGDGVFRLLAEDGSVIVSSNRRQPGAAPRPLERGAVEGSEERNADVHNPARLLVYRKVSGFPLLTVMSRDRDQLLTNWRARSWDRVLFSGLFIALHLFLTYYLLQHMRRLHRAGDLLAQSEQRFADLFQRSPVPLALIRIDNDELVEVNDALLQQFGYRRAEFIGQSPQSLSLWRMAQAREPYVEQLRQQRSVDRYEAELCHKDGHVLTCLLSTRLIESDGRTLGIFSPIDITHQRQIENEVRRFNAELESRVVERTANLQDALTSLKGMQGELVRSEKMAALGSLVAGIAHELNTPIGNSIMAVTTVNDHAGELAAELAAERPRRTVLAKNAADIAHGGDIVHRNLQRAAALVSSFKQVAVDQSSNQRRRFDLGQIVAEIVLTLEPMSKHKCELQLEVEEGIEMDSYPGALAQILTNLLSNAIVHGFDGREGGVVTIATRAIGAELAELAVADNGGGIDAAHLDHVFDPFFTTKMGQGGSGLGMHIVYNLATELLGGTVNLASMPGQGTRVSLVLPRRAPPEAGAAKVQEPPVRRRDLVRPTSR